MKTGINMFLHSDKESNLKFGEQLGLTGDTLKMFGAALSEVEVHVLLDRSTGELEILTVNGRKVERE